VEVTPDAVRLRKLVLDVVERQKDARRRKREAEPAAMAPNGRRPA
jgi:hypothetical protein